MTDVSYRPELAEAIAVLLSEPDHDDRKIFTVTTPDAASLSELTAIATDVTGEPYRYEPLERDEWIAYRRNVGRLTGRSRRASPSTRAWPGGRPTS